MFNLNLSVISGKSFHSARSLTPASELSLQSSCQSDYNASRYPLQSAFIKISDNYIIGQLKNESPKQTERERARLVKLSMQRFISLRMCRC